MCSLPWDQFFSWGVSISVAEDCISRNDWGHPTRPVSLYLAIVILASISIFMLIIKLLVKSPIHIWLERALRTILNYFTLCLIMAPTWVSTAAWLSTNFTLNPTLALWVSRAFAYQIRLVCKIDRNLTFYLRFRWDMSMPRPRTWPSMSRSDSLKRLKELSLWLRPTKLALPVLARARQVSKTD